MSQLLGGDTLSCQIKTSRDPMHWSNSIFTSPYYLVVTVYWILSRGSRFSQINAAIALEISNPNLLKAFFDILSVSPEFKSFLNSQYVLKLQLSGQIVLLLLLTGQDGYQKIFNVLLILKNKNLNFLN